MESVAKVFVDTSVVFAAVLSETGGARVVLKLGEAGAARLLVSRQVLREAEGALKRKAPEMLPLLSVLLERAGVEVIATAPRKSVDVLLTAVGHAGDAQVVADASGAGCDYLVTLDKAHLLGNQRIRRRVPCLVGTPGEFIAWYRARFLG